MLILRVSVHDINGEAAEEGGGGDWRHRRAARGFDARVSEVEGGHGGAEGGIGEVVFGRRGGGVGERGGWNEGKSGGFERVFWGIEIWG